MKHIAKISTFYRFLVPECDTYDIAELEKLIKLLYQNYMDYNENSRKKITGLSPKKYPIWFDFLQVIRKAIYADFENKIIRDDVSKKHFNRVEKIELVIEKFAGSEYKEEIRQLDTAMRAAEKGRDRRLPLRSDWEEIKDRIMYEAVYAKFSQNPKIAKISLETGSNELIEKNDHRLLLGMWK